MCALLLGIRPVLDPHLMVIFRMIMGRDIAGRIDIRIGAGKGASTAIPPSASLRPACVSEGDVRCGADTDHDGPPVWNAHPLIRTDEATPSPKPSTAVPNRRSTP